MTEKDSTSDSQKNTETEVIYPATVAKIIDEFSIVVNRGSDNGVKKDQRFLVYNISEEIFDPESGDSLGHLEIVRGRGVVTHVQNKMATIMSDKKEKSKVTKRKNMGLLASFGTEIIEESDEGTLIPFESPEVGDKVKPL